VEPQLFTSRIRGLELPTARQLHRRLVEAQLLDGDGFLRYDPRRSDWRQAVADDAALAQKLPGLAPGVADTLQPDESPLAEVLNVAWAMHEIVSDHNRQALQWILHGGHSKPEL
jgi:hypothetical protein